MRNKKLLSTAIATALAVSAMAMPVMAAGESGSIDVDLTTKTGVLRVEVPTAMAIAVDQFEITQTGAQIQSGVFDMTNKSEMAVKVDVTSTATLGTGITLVSSTNAAATSTGNEAWLAVAAKTASDSYDDGETDSVTENSWDLTDANSNVKTFGTDNTAKQTFYLGKGSGSAAYALAIPDANNKASVSFAQFYKLTAIAAQPSDDATLQTAVDADDVYVVATGDISKDKAAVTKIAKDSTVAGGANAWAGTNTYYTADAEPAATLSNSEKYVYASMGTAGDAAGFTYVGKLSNAKETWTKDDIKKINIAYTIKGVTGTKFDEVEDDCVYGLYPDAPAATRVTGTKITNSGGATEYSTGAALAARLQSGAVQFQFDTSANNVSNLSVTKVVIDGTTYAHTAANNSNASASSDGKVYTLSGFTANSVSKVEVYYGNSLIVEYTF